MTRQQMWDRGFTEARFGRVFDPPPLEHPLRAEYLSGYEAARNLKATPLRVQAAASDLLAALKDLREAVTDAYKAGRIPAEPFVRAGNIIAAAEGRS